MRAHYVSTIQSQSEVVPVREVSSTQDSKGVKVTTIRDAGKTVTISTDQSGQTTITRTGGEEVLVPAVAPPPIPIIGTTEPAPRFDFGPQLEHVAYDFFVMCAVMVVGWPIARALGRRIERRPAVVAPDPASAEQLRRIEQAVEAMAIEVERISESQRFMAKLQDGATADRV